MIFDILGEHNSFLWLVLCLVYMSNIWQKYRLSEKGIELEARRDAA